MDEVGARAGRDRAGAVRGVRAVRLHHRHFRPVLPPVRAHHRGRDRDLADRVADAVAGAVRAAAQAARARSAGRAGGSGRSTASSACSTAASTRLGARLRLARRARRCASPSLMLVVYAGILAFGLNEFRKTPLGFIPQLDRGYLIVVAQLPPGASLARTDAVLRARRRHRARDARASRTRSTSSASPARPSPMRRMPARSSSCSIRSRSAPRIRSSRRPAIQRRAVRQARGDPGSAS